MKQVRFGCFMCLPVLVALFAAEVILRVGGYTPYYLDGNAFIASRDPVMGYELKPGFKGLYAGVPISINSHGFRTKEVAYRGYDSNFRVAILGDSIAFGQGVPDADTLAEQLETKLRRKRANVEVINFGVPGYDTCQESASFKAKGSLVRPSVIVLLYYENDTDGPVFKVENGRVMSPDVRSGLFGDVTAILRRRSFLYNLVWSHWQVVKRTEYTDEQYRRILQAKFSINKLGWERSRRCLSELIYAARTSAIRIIVVPFPVLSGLNKVPYPFNDYIATICDAARVNEVECLDVLPAVRAPGIRLAVSNVENHPSAEVFSKIAEQVATRLQ